MRTGGLNIDDDARLYIDQVVRRVSEKRRTAGCTGPLGCRVRHGDVAAGALGTIYYLKPLQVLAHRATGLLRAVGELLSRLARQDGHCSG